MVTNPVSALTNLAVAAFQASSGPSNPLFRAGIDPVLDGAPELHEYFPGAFQSEAMKEALESLGSDPAMEPLLPKEGRNDLFFSSATGGSRVQFETVPYGLVGSALRLMYFRSAEATEGALASLVIENYEELKRALLGEEVRTYEVFGLTGLELPDGLQISTPWGIVKSAPETSQAEQVDMALRGNPQTTAVLLRPRLIRFEVTREGSPEANNFDEEFADQRRIYELLPLAFALATNNETRCAPRITFRTTLHPFTPGSGSSGFASPSRMHRPAVALGPEQISAVEGWARRLNTEHVDGLQVAAKRIVSAITERYDKADALIDAVTVWETLVGTNSETVFRVTAALAKLLESDPGKRKELRTTLGKVYNTRSRIVHGDVVDPASLDKDADVAIDVALSASRAIYDRGGDWLSIKSTERADRLILGE